MATSSSPPPPPPPPPPQSPPQYWYHCDKRVLIESQPDDVICTECKFGFVESIPAAATVTTVSNGAAILSPENVDEPTLGSQFLQVLRLLAQVSREGDATSPPQQSPQEQEPPPANGSDPIVSDDSDFLRIEIDGWDEDNQIQDQNQNQIQNRRENDEDEEDEDDDDDDDDVRSVEIEGHTDEEEEEDFRRRRRRDVLRLRLRDFASRARTDGRNRILDWAEILMGLEDNSIEFRFETTDRYIGNPGDYVDGAEYEALLQNLADAEGRRGAPPASKSAIDGLEVKTVNDECFMCAICKDSVNFGGVVKEMPCGHGYHSDCIVPWLESRNSCPVCRFELPTDDDEYEEEKKKKFHGGSSSGNSI